MLIGLLGLKGSGKDTAAGMLVEHGFTRMAFADALYAEAAAAFEVTPFFLSNRDSKELPLERLALKHCRDTQFVELVTAEELSQRRQAEEILAAPRSPRWLLQQWGTEYRRQSRWGREEYWVEPVVRRIGHLPAGADIVLSDVREGAEVELVRARGGRLVRINRRKVEEQDAQARAAGLVTELHSSEILARTCGVDFEVENVEGDPQAMRSALWGYVFPAQAGMKGRCMPDAEASKANLTPAA